MYHERTFTCSIFKRNKGIWLWSVPKYDEDKNINTFFVDTEGLGSTNRSSTHDSRIFALALLLSSFFVYNSRGVIDGQAIEDLSLVTNLTQVIQAKSSESESGDGSNLAQFFPTFMWIVRDFTLKLVDDKGAKISSSQYLENCLAPQEGFSDSIVSKNRIRELICSFFRERDCLTMVRPAEGEEVLRDLSSQPLSSLRPEFQKAIAQFKAKVEGGSRPKQMMGRILNGDMLVTLVKSYVTALNSGGVPVISSAWERVLATQCQDAKIAALALYDEDMKSGLVSLRQKFDSNSGVCPVPDEMLSKIHDAAKNNAKKCFWSKVSTRDDDKAIETAAKLKDELRKLLENATVENLSASEQASEAYLTDLTKSVMNRSSSSSFLSPYAANDRIVIPSASVMKEVLSDMGSKIDAAVSKMKMQSAQSFDAPTADCYGPQLKVVLMKFLTTKMLDEVVNWGGAVAESIRQAGNTLQHELDLLKRDVDGVQSRITTKTALVDQQKQSSERSIKSLNDLLVNEEQRHAADMERKLTEINRYETMHSDLMSMHKQAMDAMELRASTLREKLSHERDNLVQEEKKLSGNEFSLMNDKDEADNMRKNEKKKLEEARSEQEKKIAVLETTLSKIKNDLDDSKTRFLEQNKLALNREKAAQRRALEAEKATLEADAKEEREMRAENLRKLQAMITEKSTQLLNLKEGAGGAKFNNPMFKSESDSSSSNAGEGQSAEVAPITHDGKKKKKKFLGLF